ncbi:MFS transporter [Paenibacillus chondroitinus]|uniref:MFS transporter n=1 Tax=Paenibacillus chondroitinus TaxID=59842 RepID=A0ABU6DN74_9BACL|nr:MULTISPECIES: MFS transporter [Paenibacillus]MCY9662074.1 MFS transporter [Paenibacillus anseongense]MEB4798291.1 MFS transporter [Paenibacillus chondroitinus]
MSSSMSRSMASCTITNKDGKLFVLEMALREGLAPRKLTILIMVIIVAGMSQGMLLPLLTILLDRSGVSTDANGLNAAALYIGIFSTMFFIEKPVRRFGYKPVIMVGMGLVIAANCLFPAWQHIGFWFVLRLMVGVGDSALHYATQLWIVTSSPKEHRGRNITLYGMAYGIGFSIGPVGITLLKVGIWGPFLTTSSFFIVILLLMTRLKNERPERGERVEAVHKRASKVAAIAWFPLITSLLYGYMEASMNSNFPLYGLRIGLSEANIGVLLPVMGVGGLIMQLPLGIWSDRIGRKKILISSGLIGALAFLCIPFAGTKLWLIGLLFAIAGGMVGSFFSLGLAYAADILPRHLLPTANVLASIQYSVGSIAGPLIGGMAIRYSSAASIFYVLSLIYVLFALSGLMFRRERAA